MKDQEQIDEILERLWLAEESGPAVSVDRLMQNGIEEPDRLLGGLVEKGMVRVEGESILLSDEGRRAARRIIRQHRLAECLFSEVLLLGEEDVESTACHMEHLLNPNIMESVCTFLGHPTRCPHGKKIPKGDCCSRFVREVKPLVCPLPEAELGRLCKVVFIHSRSGARLERLSALGLNPGAAIKVKQRNPSFVIEVGETLVALDPEIAELIYVKRNGMEGGNENGPPSNQNRRRERKRRRRFFF